MFSFLKITKNKVKLFLLFLLSFSVFAFLCNFLGSVIIKGISSQIQINVIIHFFNFLNLLVVSYILVAFIKKEFFIKKYFIKFIEALFILFISEKIFTAVLFLLYKFFPAEIYFSNIMQVIGILFGGVIYYIAVCCVDSFIAK